MTVSRCLRSVRRLDTIICERVALNDAFSSSCSTPRSNIYGHDDGGKDALDRARRFRVPLDDHRLYGGCAVAHERVVVRAETESVIARHRPVTGVPGAPVGVARPRRPTASSTLLRLSLAPDSESSGCDLSPKTTSHVPWSANRRHKNQTRIPEYVRNRGRNTNDGVISKNEMRDIMYESNNSPVRLCG